MSPRAFRYTAVLFVLSFTCLGVATAVLVWRDLLWQREVYALAGELGTRRALSDSRQGKLRIYEFAGPRNEEKFSGQYDGAFEVCWPYYSSLIGRPHRFAVETVIKFYNQRMRGFQGDGSPSVVSTNGGADTVVVE